MYAGVTLGFYMGWLWVLFLNGPLLQALSAGWAVPADKVFLGFLFCHAASLLAISKLSGRVGLSPTFSGRQFFPAGAATSAGCIAVAFAGPASALQTSLIAAGVLLAAAGSAIILTGCGVAFSRLPIRCAAGAFAAAVLIGTVLSNGLGLLPTPPASLLAAALPAAAGWQLARLLAGPQAEPAGAAQRSARLPAKLKLLIALFYTTGGLMFRITGLYGSSVIFDNYWLTNFWYCTVCLAAGVVIYKFPSIDLRFIYRPVVPLLAAGFMLFPLLPVAYSFLPFAFLQTGYALFDSYAWLLFVYLAARHNNGQAIIAEGMFYTTLFIIIGQFTFSDASPLAALAEDRLSLVAYSAAVVILLSTLVFRDEAETFAGLGNGTHKQQQPAETPPLSLPQELAAVSEVQGPVTRKLPTARLTEREAEILALLARGRNNPYIVEYLNISSNTLKTHLRNLYRKCGVANRQELINLLDNPPV